MRHLVGIPEIWFHFEVSSFTLRLCSLSSVEGFMYLSLAMSMSMSLYLYVCVSVCLDVCVRLLRSYVCMFACLCIFISIYSLVHREVC